MIKKLQKMNKLSLYIICICIVYIILIIVSLMIKDTNTKYKYKNYEYKNANINEINEIYNIDVNYPRFINEECSKIITDYLYEYVSNFKEKAKKEKVLNTLEINYEIELVDSYYNILFNIKNSLNTSEKYKSILLDNKNKKEMSISDIYGKEVYNEIKDLIKKKYPDFLFNKINELDLNKLNYSFKSDHINIYINNDLINDIVKYDVFVTKILNKDTYVFEEVDDKDIKYMAFTFDDGPSEYTKDIVDAFYLNNSKATFFMLGSKMKNMTDVVKYTDEYGMEIGSHTYSHKNLSEISTPELLEEVNSVTILYKEILGKDLKLLRPPYGAVNENVKNNVMFPLITWSIDPYDWLHKETEKIVNHVLDAAADGRIILMHDIYPTSRDAVKILIPELKKEGYKLISVSELAEIKGKTLNPGEVIREM